MTSCTCDSPSQYRATSENAGSSFLYLRCSKCGNKAGRVSVDEKDMREHVTPPEDAGGEVVIRLQEQDSFFTMLDDRCDDHDHEISELYGKRHIEREDYWVYVLDCRDRFYYDDYNDLQRRAEKRLGKTPSWLRMAWEARRLKYVGQTENLFKRLGEHFEQNRTTTFTELFEPNQISYLRPARTRNHAERLEEQTAKTFYDKDDVYAYWN